MKRNLLLAGACLAAVWGAAAVATSPSRNPTVDDSLTLEASATMPPDVAATLESACYDCHSDRTNWPWYARVPPASWLAAHDVDEGRGQLNFSRWAEYNPFDRADKLDEACRLVSRQEMPLWAYRLLHPAARLSDRQIVAFCTWTDKEAARLVARENE